MNVVIDSDDVRRYCLAKIDNLTVTKSPFWLKNFLAKFGISSVNNLVDATNYFMITTGQPLHAFDYNLIDKSKIFISDKIDSEIEQLNKNYFDILFIEPHKIIIQLGIYKFIDIELIQLTIFYSEKTHYFINYIRNNLWSRFIC